MGRIGHEPLIYSNKSEDRKQMIFLSAVFSILTVGFIGFGIFLGSLNDQWWVLLFITPIVIITGIIAYTSFPSKQENIYEMMILEDGIHQMWHNEENEAPIENTILFHDIDQVLVGLYSKKIPVHEGNEEYRINALLIIMHNNRYFFQEIMDAKELYEWVKRLHDRVPSIRYTDYDLKQAYDTHTISPIDFSIVPSSEDNIVSDWIGTEKDNESLKTWMPHEHEEGLHTK